MFSGPVVHPAAGAFVHSSSTADADGEVHAMLSRGFLGGGFTNDRDVVCRCLVMMRLTRTAAASVFLCAHPQPLAVCLAT